jgi:hypothetical protein
MSKNTAEITLRFDTEALERCFLAADILAEDFGRPATEYAFLGLSDITNPLHVVATLLLPRQSVSPASVEQPGHGVFAMRREIAMLSQSQGRQLVPITFIHRHPGSCAASTIDFDFLTGPFLRQLSTLIRFDGLADEKPQCDECAEPAASSEAPEEGRRYVVQPGNQVGLAFSVIVNRKRQHRIYAATRTDCSICSSPVIRLLPARLASNRGEPASPQERARQRASLRGEIAAKVEFASETLFEDISQ